MQCANFILKLYCKVIEVWGEEKENKGGGKEADNLDLTPMIISNTN